MKYFGLDNQGIDYAADQYNEKILTPSDAKEARSTQGRHHRWQNHRAGLLQAATMTQNGRPLAVELKGLEKSFGPVHANAGIDLRVEKGSIHAVIGENGAGKSTAMKMLYGIYRPDSGQIFINGAERKWDSPRDAILAGVGMVHQHFMLAEPETALENVLLEGAPSNPA